jgi:hypothetical protein
MNRSENRYNAVKKQKKNVNLIWRKEFRRIKKKHTHGSHWKNMGIWVGTKKKVFCTLCNVATLF